MKIVVAEDDRATRLLLTRTLAGWGYEVVATADGEEAWEAIRVEQARVLVSDWEMPRLSGPELCRRIRERSGSYVYTLLLTSHRESARIVEGLDAGADDFVSKPFEPAELRARLGVGRRVLRLEDDLARKFEELERANEQLARIAAVDPLMNIGNRRSFEEAMARASIRAVVERSRYGVVMIDVDHFKRFNDRHGHATGDRVLSAVAAALAATKEPRDELFRWGGEEVILVAPGRTAATLRDIAERLRLAVAALRIEVGIGESLGVTASFGGALADEPETPFTAVVEWADQALYVAKNAGRNCVVIRGMNE